MSSPLLGLGFINAIVFGVEAQAIRALGEKTTYTHFVSGAFAGAVQCIVCSPMELAKTQMQVQGVGQRTLAKVCILMDRQCHCGSSILLIAPQR